MLSGDEFYDDDVTSGIFPDDERDPDMARRNDEDAESQDAI